MYINGHHKSGTGHDVILDDDHRVEAVPALAQPQSLPTREVDYERLLTIGRELLIALGEDPDREDISDTPRRWAGWWREFIEYDPGNTETVFNSSSAGQMVVVSGIKVWSLCEHHLLPFSCDISIGYVIHNNKILGLSKFARIAHQCAHRLQIQERLVQQIADEIERITGSANVAVLARGEHLCMTMRGIQTPATMSSSVMRGAFLHNPNTRAEFFQMLNG